MSPVKQKIDCLRFECLAEDQAGGVLPAGVTVSPGAPVSLASGAAGQVSFTLRADNSAVDSGQGSWPSRNWTA
jgi:hypothetical protein